MPRVVLWFSMGKNDSMLAVGRQNGSKPGTLRALLRRQGGESSHGSRFETNTCTSITIPLERRSASTREDDVQGDVAG